MREKTDIQPDVPVSPWLTKAYSTKSPKIKHVKENEKKAKQKKREEWTPVLILILILHFLSQIFKRFEIVFAFLSFYIVQT